MNRGPKGEADRTTRLGTKNEPAALSLKPAAGISTVRPTSSGAAPPG